MGSGGEAIGFVVAPRYSDTARLAAQFRRPPGHREWLLSGGNPHNQTLRCDSARLIGTAFCMPCGLPMRCAFRGEGFLAWAVS